MVGVLAGGGHEEDMPCNDSAWGLSPSGLAPRLPRAGLPANTSGGEGPPSRATWLLPWVCETPG